MNKGINIARPRHKFRDTCGADKLLIGDGGTELSLAKRTFSGLPTHCKKHNLFN